MLHGHERSITQIKYNKDGDLLFSSAKDSSPGVWYSVNGERLGTYDGHTGVVWSLDVKWDTTQLLTGAGDNRLIQWDVETGTLNFQNKFTDTVVPLQGYNSGYTFVSVFLFWEGYKIQT